MAIWNGTLFYKSGTLWKYISNGTNYNPCAVNTAYDVTDYNNLQCIDNYTYDSGWYYGGQNLSRASWYYRLDNIGLITWIWAGNIITCSSSTATSCVSNGYTYYSGNVVSSGEYDIYWQIKQTQNRQTITNFSSF